MSLILDALRRADAERERGNVPGLHTPQPMAPAAVPAGRLSTPVVVLSVLAGAAFAGGVAAWWHWRQPVGVPAVVAVAPVAPAPRAAAPVVETVVVAPVPAPVTVAPQVTAAAPVGAPKKVEAVKPPVAPPVPGVVRSPAPAVASVEPARVQMLQDLPAAVRQQLPALAVSGASYSADPAYRMVIVNGQVLHEGDQAANGVLLEAIAPRQVIFKGLGQRWGQGY